MPNLDAAMGMQVKITKQLLYPLTALHTLVKRLHEHPVYDCDTRRQSPDVKLKTSYERMQSSSR